MGFGKMVRSDFQICNMLLQIQVQDFGRVLARACSLLLTCAQLWSWLQAGTDRVECGCLLVFETLEDHQTLVSVVGHLKDSDSPCFRSAWHWFKRFSACAVWYRWQLYTCIAFFFFCWGVFYWGPFIDYQVYYNPVRPWKSGIAFLNYCSPAKLSKWGYGLILY
jgi:hypothetical protein